MNAFKTSPLESQTPLVQVGRTKKVKRRVARNKYGALPRTQHRKPVHKTHWSRPVPQSDVFSDSDSSITPEPPKQKGPAFTPRFAPHHRADISSREERSRVLMAMNSRPATGDECLQVSGKFRYYDSYHYYSNPATGPWMITPGGQLWLDDATMYSANHNTDLCDTYCYSDEVTDAFLHDSICGFCHSASLHEDLYPSPDDLAATDCTTVNKWCRPCTVNGCTPDSPLSHCYMLRYSLWFLQPEKPERLPVTDTSLEDAIEDTRAAMRDVMKLPRDDPATRSTKSLFFCRASRCREEWSCYRCFCCEACCICGWIRPRRTRRPALPMSFQRPPRTNAQSLTSWLNTTVTHEHTFTQLDDLTTFLSSLQRKVEWATVLKEAGFLAGHLTVGGLKASNIVLAFTHFLSNIGLGTKFVTFFTTWFKERLKSNIQSYVDTMSWLPVIGTAIVAVVASLVLMKLPHEKSIDSCIMRCSRIGQLIGSYDKISEKCAPLLEEWTDYFRRAVFGYSKRDMDGWSEIDKWLEEVASLQNSGFEREARVNKELAIQVDKLIAQGNAFNKRLDSIRVPPAARVSIQNACLFLVRARSQTAASGAGLVKPRIAPVVFHFFGTSGVGKSTMLGFLNTDLLLEAGCKEPTDLHDKIYYRRPVDEDWDGYFPGTLGVVCDDFGALRDAVGAPSVQAHENIHMANTAHFPLSMPHLEDKGQVCFEAQWIIWTSNRPNFTFESLTNPEAVYNRVTLKFRHYVKPEFTKTVNINNQEYESLDHVKLIEALKTDPQADQNCMLFDLMHPTSSASAPIKVGLTYREMSDMCVAALAAKQESGASMLDRQSKYFTDRLNNVQVFREHTTPEYAVLSENRERLLKNAVPTTKGLVSNSAVRLYGGPSIFSMIGTTLNPFKWLGRTKAIMSGQEHEAFEGVHLDVFASLSERPYLTLYPPLRKTTSRFWQCCCVRAPYSKGSRVINALQRCYGAALSSLEPEKAFASQAALEIDLVNLPDLPCECKGHVYNPNRSLYLNGLVGPPSSSLRRTIGDFTCRHFETILLSLSVAFYFILPRIISALFPPPADAIYIPYGLNAKFYNFTPEECKTYLAWMKKWPSPDTLEGIWGPYYECKRPPQLAESLSPGKTALPSQHHEASSLGVAPGSAEAVAYESFQRGKTALPNQTHESIPNIEATSDQNATEVRMAIFKNIYLLLNKVGDNYVPLSSLLVVLGRIALVNRHTWEMAKDDLMISTVRGGIVYKIRKSECNVALPDPDDANHGDKDVVAIELPRTVHSHSDLTKHFMTKEDFARHKSLPRVELFGYTRQGFVASRFSDRVTVSDKVAFALTNLPKTWYIREHYKYGIETEAGDCGSALIAYDPSMSRKIAGIHMAGETHSVFTGVAVAIHQEFLTSLLQKLTLKHPDSAISNNIQVFREAQIVIVDGKVVGESNVPDGFVPIGREQSKIYQAVKTTYRPSPVAGMVQTPTTRPACLAPKVVDGAMTSPLHKAMLKAATPSVRVHPDYLEWAYEDVCSMILTDIRESDQQLLTFEESISGRPGDPCYAPMNRSSGPGFGWPKIGKGKTHWLGTDEYDYTNKEFRATWDAYHLSLAKGQPIGVRWVDTLKDELRPHEKVDAGKTRLFSQGEMVYTAMLRKYFGGFAAHLMRHPIVMESCVGITAQGMQWDQLAHHLQRKGLLVVAGDFTNYDGTLAAEIIWKFCDLCNRFYEDEFSHTRYLMFVDLINSIHVAGDRVYQWTHGQPSGCALTVIINSVYHSIALRVAYCYVAAKYMPLLMNMIAFNQYVSHANYGDDDVTNIHPEIIEWFNQTTLTEGFSEFGMTYTSETKGTDAPKFRLLQEVTFLKRHFRFDHSQARYRGALILDTVMEMTNWISGKDTWELCALQLQDAMYELSHHDEQTFNTVGKLFEAQRKVVATYVSVTFLTYSGYQAIDAIRYLGVPPTHSKLVDQGMALSADPRHAANPAPVSPETNIQAAEGGVFTPTGTCVPSKNNRLSTQPTRGGLESAPKRSNRLATSTNSNSGTAVGPGFAGEQEQVYTQEITTFHQDGDVTTVDPGNTSFYRVMQRGAEDSLANEISGVVSRPILIDTFDWHTGDVTGTEMYVASFPERLLRQPMIREKLRGFRYVRFDIIVELQVNNQPFNAGALRMWYEPLGEMMTGTVSSTNNIIGMSGYPGVLWKCGDATAARFRVPFECPISHFDMVKKTGTMGKVRISVFSPLTGSSDVDVAVWAWIDNLDFTMPTGMPTLVANNAQVADQGFTARLQEHQGAEADTVPPPQLTTTLLLLPLPSSRSGLDREQLKQP